MTKVAEEPVILTTDHRFISGDAERCITRSTEVVEMRRLEGPVAKVRWGLGLTINLGNYESARLDLSIEVPCLIQDVDAAARFGERFVEQRLLEKAKDPMGAKRSNDG